MNEFKIGHFTDERGGTGCTVVLCPPATRASGWVRGAAPGTREYALLDPHCKVDELHALLLTGGSAFGLDAAAGVMKYLKEREIGYQTGFARVPIVPAAVIYDLYSGKADAFPTPADAYQACLDARAGNRDKGRIGAGTGATVGKWAGLEYMMPGGVGRAQISLNGLWVDALAVVNPVGDVVDREGKIVAGAQKAGRFLAEDHPETRWNPLSVGFGENTTLVVVMTNAALDKLHLHIVSGRVHNGVARAIIPSHTSYDGDIVFALSNGRVKADPDTVAELAVEAARRAVVDSVR